MAYDALARRDTRAVECALDRGEIAANAEHTTTDNSFVCPLINIAVAVCLKNEKSSRYCETNNNVVRHPPKQSGNTRLVTSFVNCGADVDKSDTSGRTPLRVAAEASFYSDFLDFKVYVEMISCAHHSICVA